MLIQIDDVTFRYDDGDFALRVPELGVEQGETVAVIGPSGSGKTTLLHLVAGIVVPESGRIIVDGTEVSGLKEVDRRTYRATKLGLVFQEFELLDYLDVRDNVLLPYRLSPALELTGAVRGRVDDVAALLGIGDKLSRNVRRLSQGERQRVAIARALVTEAPVLLADEPTGNLDPRNKDIVLRALVDAVKATGATLLAVTHDHAELGRFERTIDVASFHTVGATS